MVLQNDIAKVCKSGIILDDPIESGMILFLHFRLNLNLLSIANSADAKSFRYKNAINDR